MGSVTVRRRLRSEQITEMLSSRQYTISRAVIVSLGVLYALSTFLPFDSRPPLLDTWFYSVVLVATAGFALVRPLTVQRDQAGWACIALGVVSWCIGDIYWSAAFSGVDSDKIPVPSPADLFYVGMYPFAYLGLILIARSTVNRLPVYVFLDGVVSSLAAGAVFSALTLKEIIPSAAGGQLAQTLTNLSYPIGDLVLMVVAVAALAMIRWRRDPVWWVLGLGAALFATADTAYLFQLAHGTYADGSWVDGLWMLGLTLLAVAGSLRRPGSAKDVNGFAALLVPIVFSLAALAVLVYGTSVKLHAVTIVLASVCLVAAGVRTALTFEQTRALARSRVEAKTDQLSNLGNRRLLDRQMPAMLAAVPPGGQVAFAIISVDQVAEINSTLGYSAGDAILAEIGNRLVVAQPQGAVAARLGGAEMALMMPATKGATAFQEDLTTMIKRLAEPVEAAGVPVHVELSAGVAFSPLHSAGGSDLIRCADDALRRAKEGRSQVEIYDPRLDLGRDFGPSLFPDLVQGLGDGQFIAYYQPKVDLISGSPIELEAVLRWHHPTRGVLGPDVVLPLAARAGLTRQLTQVLIGTALRQCAGWRRRGIQLGVAIDLTAADVLDSSLPYTLVKMINSLGLPPAAVTLEIAEDVLLIDPRRTSYALSQLRTFGLRLALDHFGRSAPSITRLRSLPLDELKFDSTFVAPVPNSPRDAAIVRATVELAASLNMRTVADGVHSGEVRAALVPLGITGGQGAALGEPMDPAQLRRWLEPLMPAPAYGQPATWTDTAEQPQRAWTGNLAQPANAPAGRETSWRNEPARGPSTGVPSAGAPAGTPGPRLGDGGLAPTWASMGSSALGAVPAPRTGGEAAPRTSGGLAPTWVEMNPAGAPTPPPKETDDSTERVR